MTAKTHTLDDSQRRNRDMEIVDEVVQIISAKLDTSDLLQSIVSQVAHKLDCTHCTIFFPEEVEGKLYLVPQKTHGRRSKEIMTRRFKVGDEHEEGLAGYVFRTGKSLALANAKEHPSFAVAREQRKAPRSMLVVPIRVGDRKIGVISADQDVYGHFSDNNRRLVEILAQHAGIAIERATGLERLQDISRRIIGAPSMKETLRQIVSGAIKLTRTTAGVIYLISDDGQSITGSFEHPPDFEHPPVRMKGEGGITRRIIATGEVMVFPDIRQDPRVNPLIYECVHAMIGVPLKSGEKVIGVLYLNDAGPHDFTETEVSLLSTLANQAAAAIEIFQRRARDLEIINEVVQIINTKLDTEALLNSIASQIAYKLKCTHCTLFFPKEVKGVLYLVPRVTHGVRREIMSRRFKVGDPREEGLAGWVFRTGESLALANAKEDPRFAKDRQQRDAPRSMLVVPIQVAERTIGIISADQDVRGHFSESDRRLVEALGQHAGIAIQNARRYQMLRQSNEIGQSLLAVQASPEILKDTLEQIVDTAKEVLEADTVDLYQYFAAKDDFDLPPIRVGERRHPELIPSEVLPDDVVARVARTGRGIFESDASGMGSTLVGAWETPREGRPNERFVVREGIISSAGVPLKTGQADGQQVVGVLFVSYRHKRDFDRDVELRERIETLANLSAIAIENARLFEKVQEEVAERRRAQEALDRERNLLRTMIDNLPDYIYAKDTESRFTVANIATARLVGKTEPDEILGKTDYDFFQREFALQYRADEEKIMRSGQPLVSQEELVIDHAGNKQWVLATKVPLRDSQENIVGLAGLNRVITDRKQAEKALEERAEQLELLQEVTATISAKPSDLKEILRLIVGGLGAIFPGASCMMRLYDKDGGEFTTEIATGALLDLGSLLPRPGGTSQHVLENKMPRYLEGDALVEPPDRGPAVRKDVLDQGVMAAAYVPLRSKEDAIGVLSVFFTESHHFSNNDKRVLELFADQAAIAIENARLFKRLQEQRVLELETLSQLGDDLATLEQEL